MTARDPRCATRKTPLLIAPTRDNHSLLRQRRSYSGFQKRFTASHGAILSDALTRTKTSPPPSTRTRPPPPPPTPNPCCTRPRRRLPPPFTSLHSTKRPAQPRQWRKQYQLQRQHRSHRACACSCGASAPTQGGRDRLFCRERRHRHRFRQREAPPRSMPFPALAAPRAPARCSFATLSRTRAAPCGRR